MECRNNRFKCARRAPTTTGLSQTTDTSFSKPYVGFSAQENGLTSGPKPVVTLRVCPSASWPLRYANVCLCALSVLVGSSTLSHYLSQMFPRGCRGTQLPGLKEGWPWCLCGGGTEINPALQLTCRNVAELVHILKINAASSTSGCHRCCEMQHERYKMPGISMKLALNRPEEPPPGKNPESR